MIKIEKSIVIEGPVEEVFAYASDLVHAREYFTGVEKVSDVRSLPSGGYSFKSVNKVDGLHTEMTSEDVAFVRNERMVARARGALDEMLLTATFERLEGGKTQVTCIEEHTLQGGILGKLGEPFFAKYLDHAAELTQASLKACIETGVPAEAVG